MLARDSALTFFVEPELFCGFEKHRGKGSELRKRRADRKVYLALSTKKLC